VGELAKYNIELELDKLRIRNIMDGGPEGIMAIMAWNKGRQDGASAASLGEDLPSVNMMASGVERLGQKVGQIPTLKMPFGPKDEDNARSSAEVRERLVQSWDHMSVMRLQFPQIGRWLPGYGSYSWKLCPKHDPVTRQRYPHAELRDPFDTWTGWLGPMQDPTDIAYRRVVPLAALEKIYPRDDWRVLEERVKGQPDSVMYGTPRNRGWEGPRHGVAVIEYICSEGTYVCVPEAGVVVDYYPNILTTGLPFVYKKRISFNRLVSQYHHIIGLSAQQAKLNILALIAAEDATFRETNIIGEMEGNTYEKGRDAVNHYTRGTTIDRPTGGEGVAQLFAQIDRVTAMLRIGAAYDEGSDSLAARGGFITGRGQDALRDPVEANIKEYHTIITVGTEELDTKRLEWEQEMEKGEKKRVFWIEGGAGIEELYEPDKDIDGNWRSHRVYGLMATWDDPSKIVTALQLLQGEIIDVTEIQDNLDGLQDAAQMNQRMRRQKAEKTLMFALEQRAVNNDPAATMALIEIRDTPNDIGEILTKFFTPAEPQMSPEEAALAQQDQGLEPPGGVPTVQTILSRLTGGGQAEGGVQTVGTNVA